MSKFIYLNFVAIFGVRTFCNDTLAVNVNGELGKLIGFNFSLLYERIFVFYTSPSFDCFVERSDVIISYSKITFV